MYEGVSTPGVCPGGAIAMMNRVLGFCVGVVVDYWGCDAVIEGLQS